MRWSGCRWLLVGDFGRFASGEKLVAYLGLHKKIRQSANRSASHGHVAKSGRADDVTDLRHAGRGAVGCLPRTRTAKGRSTTGSKYGADLKSRWWRRRESWPSYVGI
ncbi:transposase [Rhodococcus sp. DK17]|uniref:transposase n=1 Tax=unclassified Rhodococcus (in: high G+C Gram-positive bacteria) TaxID=192944 RepID=UPI0009FF8216